MGSVPETVARSNGPDAARTQNETGQEAFERGSTRRVVEVGHARTLRTGRAMLVGSEDLRFSRKDLLSVATDRGEVFVQALVDSSRQTLPHDAYYRVLRRIPRAEAEALLARDEAREKAARAVFVDLVRRHRLDMHLSAVEISRSDSRIVFYFTSPGRVDFRGLVRDLASALQSRIELRQIGVRDESRCTGGLGPCGMPLCCATHLRDFTTVTIRMAKTQGLVLNPAKVSGVCGRLMCCLAYEHEVYAEMKKAFPKTGTIVITPQGEGRIKEHLIMRQAVRVALGPGQFVDIPLKDLVFKQAPEPQAPEPDEPDDGEDSDVVT